MDNKEKKNIQTKLAEYVGRFDSQNQASFTIEGVSSATISQILNNNWSLIKPSMWRSVANQIGYLENEWIGANTQMYKRLTMDLKLAQIHSEVMGFVARAGSGKTHTCKAYARDHKNVFLIRCNEYFTKKDFLTKLLIAMGKDYTGYHTNEMMKVILTTLKGLDKPLIIMDEADKLKNDVLYFFISLYNELEDYCGIILIATNYLEKRIVSGVQRNTKGCKEIYSRVGGKFIPLPELSFSDVALICITNGVENKNFHKKVFEDCNSDLRRVKRLINAYKRELKKKQVAA